MLLSGCGGPIHVSSVSSNPQLTHIAVAPGSSALCVGQTLQFTVSGTFSDGSSKDVSPQVRWTSSNAAVGSVTSTGMLHAKAIGVVSIAASVDGMIASTDVKVNGAAPQSIEITPSAVALIVGQKAQLSVTATLTDGTLQNVTHSVTWAISDPSVVGIDSNGLASALKAGTSAFTANLGGSGSATVSGNSTATIAPELLTVLQISAHDPSMPLGTAQQLSAVGTYNDGAIRDLTATVSWSSSASSILGVSATGAVNALAIGSATVSALAAGITTSMALNVSNPVLSSIRIEPPNPSILVSESVQLKAIGTFTDGSTSDLTATAAWTIDDPRLLEIDPNGNAIAFSPGTASVQASLNGLTGNASVVVRPVALVSYFSGASGKTDTTMRIVGTARIDPEICTMLYVFNQDQQMSECCGCQISREGLRNLSLKHDLVSNPLTGIAPDSGTVVLVTSALNGSNSCNPAMITPSGFGDAWATHIQSTDPSLSSTETPFTKTELGDSLLTNLQAQCNYVQALGSGQGVCSCGTGD